MKMQTLTLLAGLAIACAAHAAGPQEVSCPRVAALDGSAWSGSTWISAADAKVATESEMKRQRAAGGASWFIGEFVPSGKIEKAVWMTTGLGVYELYVNGTRVGGEDALKPGYTCPRKTRRSFTYDVTALMKTGKGSKNVLAAESTAGWWRDQIVKFHGKKSAFRAVLEVTYADGTKQRYGTDASWKAGVAGKTLHAAIFDGEEYDARNGCPALGCAGFAAAEENREFSGDILPTDGAEILRRRDLAMDPVQAYCWRGATGTNNEKGHKKIHGVVIKTREFKSGEPLKLSPGETLVVDFGQNCAGVPRFTMKADRGVKLRCLFGEMLNDTDGSVARGNDGPGGSVYLANLRIKSPRAMRADYTFAGDSEETYMPRFTFFGYRYLSVTADGDVEISALKSIPVTSISKDRELGKIETGDADLNRFIANVYWGQLSNYLSVPTDCPQRNERLGWTADTQVFAEAGAFNADTVDFLRKWMRDMVDSQDADGGFPSVAPYGQYGNGTFVFGWGDAGVIVPWTIWKQFGDRRILEESWEAMARFVRKLDETKYKYDDKRYVYADWLSYETFETCGNKFGNWRKWRNDPDARNYREYLAACYWLYDSRLMVQMANALGKKAEAEEFGKCAERALKYIRSTYLEADGLLLKPMRHLQTASVFALHFGVVEGDARTATLQLLKDSIRKHGDCLQTGFLGTAHIMDALTGAGAVDVAYTLLLQHKNPSWLYSVDQGATTVWERWNSYTKAEGFGNVGMNSFNHYAYGSVLAWLYRTAAGIASTPDDPGFATIVMAPKPDRRLGRIKAEYRVKGGTIKSAWRYEGDKWIWEFTVPAGSKALVTVPGESASKTYGPGDYRIERAERR